MNKKYNEIFEAAVNLDFEKTQTGLDSLSQEELNFLLCVVTGIKVNVSQRITTTKSVDKKEGLAHLPGFTYSNEIR